MVFIVCALLTWCLSVCELGNARTVALAHALEKNAVVLELEFHNSEFGVMSLEREVDGLSLMFYELLLCFVWAQFTIRTNACMSVVYFRSFVYTFFCFATELPRSSDCTGLDDAGAEALAVGLKKNTTLRALDIGRCGGRGECVAFPVCALLNHRVHQTTAV
jgi:hypothetical protein